MFGNIFKRKARESPELDEPWRDIKWGERDRIETELRNVKLSNPRISYLRVMVLGPVGSGKSSFIDAASSVFKHRVVTKADVAYGSTTTKTKQYRVYKIRNGKSGHLPFIFNELMGLQDETATPGIHRDDIVNALKGHMKDNYMFNPMSSLKPGEAFYNENPRLDDKIHCVVSIMPAPTISLRDQKIINTMKSVIEEANDLRIPNVVILTKIDECCLLVKKDLTKVYKSKKIKQKIAECSSLLGIPLTSVFPVKNYHEEFDPDYNTDVLILSALRRVFHMANDCVEDLGGGTSENAKANNPEWNAEAKREEMPTRKLGEEFEEQWREMPWGGSKDLKERLSRFKLNHPTEKFVRILMVGDAGAGKSSFINSVYNAFQHRITSRALVAKAFGTSFTKEYETHYIKGQDGSVLPFIFNDVMGLEGGIGYGVRAEDIISALKGLIEEGYRFDPECALYEASNEDRGDLSDQCFCLVNVVDLSRISFIDQGVVAKLKLIREAASELKLPQVIIMTKPDDACPLVKKNLRKIYYSKKIKQKMEECSNLLGIPMSHIFPLKCYHEEVDTKDDIDLLILKALDQIVRNANDALEKNCRLPDAQKDTSKPWREMKWGKTKELEDKLKNLQIVNNEVQHIRILVVGEIGAGKSSFINSVNNSFAHRITSGALVDVNSGTSFTKIYKTHYIKGEDGSRLAFMFNDIMGLEPEEGQGANEQDIIKAIKGFIKEGYKLNPASALTENSLDYRANPGLKDQTFCLVNVVDGSRVSFMDHRLIQKLQFIRQAASELNLPQVIIMTKPDETCPLVKRNLKNIYKSKKIREKMQECSNLLGIPMNHIFPVKNYHDEIDTNNDMDILILKAMDQIVNNAIDALGNISNPATI